MFVNILSRNIWNIPNSIFLDWDFHNNCVLFLYQLVLRAPKSFSSHILNLCRKNPILTCICLTLLNCPYLKGWHELLLYHWIFTPKDNSFKKKLLFEIHQAGFVLVPMCKEAGLAKFTSSPVHWIFICNKSAEVWKSSSLNYAVEENLMSKTGSRNRHTGTDFHPCLGSVWCKPFRFVLMQNWVNNFSHFENNNWQVNTRIISLTILTLYFLVKLQFKNPYVFTQIYQFAYRKMWIICEMILVFNLIMHDHQNN